MLRKFKQNIYIKLTQKFGKINRNTIAYTYLRGEGIEIGAMNYPVLVKKGVRVKYFDRVSREDSHRIFPDIKIKDLVVVDIIGDGEKLDKIDPGSNDFVIANHFIEHCQNPIQTFENILRVLRPNGYIYMVIPDKRYTFDLLRPVTTFEHLIKDYKEGPAWSEHDHYYEFVKFTEHGAGKTDTEIGLVINDLKKRNHSIHYHVWDHQAMLDMFNSMKEKMNFNFEITFCMAAMQGQNESIFILRKT